MGSTITTRTTIGCLALLTGLVVVTACGSDTARRDGPGNAVGAAVSLDRSTVPSTRTPGTLQVPKAGLRATLDDLFTEHVRLVLTTTGATASGQASEAATARAELDQNSEAIVAAIVGVYGPDAASFGQGWRMHVQAFVDDAAAAASGDEAKKADARQRLDKYPKQVGAFLASANPNLTQQAVADLVGTHIVDILGLIDRQVAGDPAVTDVTGPVVSQAAAHMTMLATALSDAIARQFPERFPG